MKKSLFLPCLALAAGLSGCHGMVNTSSQQIELDPQNALQVTVQGAEIYPVAGDKTSASKPRPGEPIHRTLISRGGSVLFAYDLQVGKADKPGSYRFLLQPAKQGPTFKSTREVVVTRADVVRVELMEQPETGQKIEDVFVIGRKVVQKEMTDPIEHLKALHNAVFHYFHDK